MAEFQFVKYELVDEGRIAVVSLNRPRQRNAQSRGLLVELDEAMMLAESDDRVAVVVLRGEGASFSAGHDLGSSESLKEYLPGPDQHPTYACNGGGREGAESRMTQEWHYFYNNTKRWREMRKVTIASVQGPVYSAGLMLMWACDLIVASENATFADVVGVRLGMAGVEYFAHPWEFGPRRTKELLLTGDSVTAREAYDWGMVNKVFPDDELVERTLDFARRIALVPTAASLFVKDAVNQSVDAMGFQTALAQSFTFHSLNHSHWAETNEDRFPAAKPETLPADLSGPVVPRERDTVRAQVKI